MGIVMLRDYCACAYMALTLAAGVGSRSAAMLRP